MTATAEHTTNQEVPACLQDAINDYESDTHAARGVLLLAQEAQQEDYGLDFEWSGPERSSVIIAIVGAGKTLQVAGHSLCLQVKAFEKELMRGHKVRPDGALALG